MDALQDTHTWRHIEDIPEDWKGLASPELKTLASIWQEHASGLAASQILQRFNDRLARHWAIETGIIEGLYKIDRGVTELLIEKGIESALIPHGTTDKPAEEIVAVLKDHQDVLEGLFDFVGSRRSLSTSYIKEVHQALCIHQDEVEAMDSQGRLVRVAMRKGAWKLHPNNPRRPDGQLHEYCPPEHVAAEMDWLIELHLQHTENGVPPEVEAAWLHHRFSQIHPFQDGNGRVARALATLVLLRAKLFPFTVDRAEREAYISHLERADKADLRPFVDMLIKSQRRALTKALSLSEGLLAEEQDIASLIEAGATRLKEKKQSQRRELEAVYALAAKLELVASQQFQTVASKLQKELQHVDVLYGCEVTVSVPENEHWFYSQVVETAKRLEYYADLRRYHHWLRLRISEAHISNVVVSFHPLGTVFRGVMAVSAFYEERPRQSAGDYAAVPIPTHIITEAFGFVYTEQLDTMLPRFEKWLHTALVLALTQWRRSM